MPTPAFDTNNTEWLENSRTAMSDKLDAIITAKAELKEKFDEHFRVFITQHGLDKTVIRSTSINPNPIEGRLEVENGNILFKANMMYPITIGNFNDYFNTSIINGSKYIEHCEAALITNYMTPEEYERRNS